MRFHVPSLLLVASLASFPLGASMVSAQADDVRARQHFEAGQSYYQRARYAEAAREWEEALRLSGRGVLLLNLSQAYERNLEFDRAIERLEQYLAQAADDPDRATHEERLTRLRELRDRMATETQSDAAASGTRAGPDPGGETGPTATSGGGLSGLGVAGLIIAGVGALAGVGAIVLGAVAHGVYSDLESQCDGERVCPASLQGDIDSGAAMADASTALTFIGLGALVAGAVMLIVDLVSGGESDSSRGSLQVTSGPGLAGLALEGSLQ